MVIMWVSDQVSITLKSDLLAVLDQSSVKEIIGQQLWRGNGFQILSQVRESGLSTGVDVGHLEDCPELLHPIVIRRLGVIGQVFEFGSNQNILGVEQHGKS